MFQIDVSSAVPVKPVPAAPGTPGWFSAGNPGAGAPATILDHDWLNNTQQELLNVLAAAGIAPDKTKFDQIATAIKTLLENAGPYTYWPCGGSANALTITPVPAITAYTQGQRWTIQPGLDNTAAVTLSVSGVGFKPVVNQDGSALLDADLKAAGAYDVVYQTAGGGRWVKQAPPSGSVLLAPSGYLRLPQSFNGTPVYLQWATYSVTPDHTTDEPAGYFWGQVTVSLPLTVANGGLWAHAAPLAQANGQHTFTAVQNLGTSSVLVYHTAYNASAQPLRGIVFGLFY